MSRPRLLSVLCAAIMAAAGPFASGADLSTHETAIIHGKLLTVSHGVIENGTVIIADGKIKAVGGAETSVPPHARVVDASGMTVYPGLIDGVDFDGVTGGSISQSRRPFHSFTPGTPVPNLSVASAVGPSDTILVDRLNGLLNAGVSPGTEGPEPGQLALIQFTDRPGSLVLSPNAALVMNFGSGAQRHDMYPSTLFGVAGFFREQLTRLRDYRAGLGLRDRQGRQIPDERLDALIPFVDGQRPIIVFANSDTEIGVALDIAQEFGLHITLAGATGIDTELERVAAAKIPVIFGSIWDIPADGQRFDHTFSIPARLAGRGVKIAIATFGRDAGGARNLPYAAGYAVAYGLSYEEALKSITLNPAQMLGAGGSLGSLDMGKQANVIIADGDPLDVKTDVKHVFIQGVEIDMKNMQTELRDRYQRKTHP
jgi:imidazolonepropionase-like amidohydrolase